MKKSSKIIIGIVIAIIVLTLALAIFFIGYTNNLYFKEPISNENTNSTENYQKYSKVIDDVKLELNIPNEWKYEEVDKNEENDFYKYALKLYKNNEDQSAILYFYYLPMGVCGTGRTTEDIILNNGKKATIGYYDGNKNWSDISFYDTNEHIGVVNSGLKDTDANEAIELIKSINISR